MSLLEFCQWVQSTNFFTAVRGSWYVYPSVMSLHLAAIALSGGMILVTDLRLLGIAMRQYAVSDIVDGLRWPKRIGFLLVLTCGALLASSKAEEYYYNAFFWAKMSLLFLVFLHGLVFRASVYRNTEALDKSLGTPGVVQVAACLSLLLWTGVAICGRGIGYIEPPIEKLHAAILR